MQDLALAFSHRALKSLFSPNMFPLFPKVAASAASTTAEIGALTMDGRKRKRNSLMDFFPTTKSGEEMLNINELTDCLLGEIFVRVPAKYVHRCMSVCKRWNLMISDHHFVNQFMRHNQKSPSSSSPSPPLVVQFHSHTDKRRITITSSESGLSRDITLSFIPYLRLGTSEPCVVGFSRDLLLGSLTSYNQRIYYIANPITKTWLELPPTRRVHDMVNLGFICEPYFKEEEGHAGHMNFRVVRIPVRGNTAKSIDIETFLSETSEWKEESVKTPPGFDLVNAPKTGVVCNGILHWLSSTSKSIFAYNPFDNGSENRFRFIDLPKDSNLEDRNFCLGFSRECLTLSQTMDGAEAENEDEDEDEVVENRYLLVWELKDYKAGNWSLDYQVCLNKFVSEIRWPLQDISRTSIGMRVICFDPNDRDCLYIWFKRCILLCNLCDVTVKVIYEIDYINSPPDTAFPLELPCWPSPVPALLENDYQ